MCTHLQVDGGAIDVEGLEAGLPALVGALDSALEGFDGLGVCGVPIGKEVVKASAHIVDMAGKPGEVGALILGSQGEVVKRRLGRRAPAGQGSVHVAAGDRAARAVVLSGLS